MWEEHSKKDVVWAGERKTRLWSEASLKEMKHPGVSEVMKVREDTLFARVNKASGRSRRAINPGQ